METSIKTTLKEEKETLFICLRAKALDNRNKNSVLHDTGAEKILKSVDYDFDKFKAESKFDNDMPNVWRAKHFDDWIRDFIAANPDAVVLYLGCGLDTRIKRINPPETVSWYDLDYPEVIELRKNFFRETANYRMIASSVTADGWIEEIPYNRPTMIVAEGLLMYLAPEDVERLFIRLTIHFDHGQMVFDVLNKWIVQRSAQQMKKTTGAVHKWGVDDLQEINRFSPKLEILDEIPVVQSQYVKQLPFGVFKVFCRTAALFPFCRQVFRFMRYEF